MPLRFYLSLCLCGFLGSLGYARVTAESVARDIAAATTLELNKAVWGLACPKRQVPILALDAFTGDDRALLTLLPAHAEVVADEISVRLRRQPAVVGVGNCEGKLSAGRLVSFGLRFNVAVEVETSTPRPMVFTLVPWSRGRRGRLGAAVSKQRSKAEAEGADVDAYLRKTVWEWCRRATAGEGRHVLRFEHPTRIYRKRSGEAAWDGFELEIQGSQGAEVAIRRVTVSRDGRPGGFRSALTLPAGEIWRAVANVNRKTRLFIDGREVPSSTLLAPRPHTDFYAGQQWQEVDLKPFLEPGRTHVLAACPAFAKEANAACSGSVVMRSGEVVRLGTDPSWAYVPQQTDDWATRSYTGPTVTVTNTTAFSASYLPDELTAIKYGFRLYVQFLQAMPAYDGRLLLESPRDTQLYLSADEPLELKARCPAGLASRDPSVEWLVCRYHKDRPLERIAGGTASSFERTEGSLAFRLAGQGAGLPMGVYVVKAVLYAADGAVLEDRLPEVLLVTGRIPMDETPGRSFADGLDVEKEAVIDFTQPDDPAFPWMEMDHNRMHEEPIVVTRNGLTYRETRPTASRFSEQTLISYNVAFRHPGDFYLLTLVYPDDRPRFFGVNLSSEHDGEGDHSKAGPSVWTGVWHPNTGRMQTMQWLFRPDPGYTSLNLVNMMPGSPAAAAEVRIEHVRGRLPALAVQGDARRLGILSATTRAYSGFGKTFRSDTEQYPHHNRVALLPGSWHESVKSHSPLRWRLNGFLQWMDTCAHYVEYLRWAGQNVHVLAYYQGDDHGHTPNAVPSSPTGAQRPAFHIGDVAARMFRDNGIDFFCNVMYASDVLLQARYADNTDLSRSPFLIDAEGNEARIWKTGYNFNHPDVRASIMQVVEEAVRKYQRLPNFSGVNFTISFGGPAYGPTYWIYERGKPLDPLAFGYSDATAQRFEADTGLDLGVPSDSPHRFGMRHQRLTGEALRTKWVQWRCENMVGFFRDLLDRLRAVKPDVKVITGHITPGYFFDHAVENHVPVAQSMREFGWDFERFHRSEGLYTMPWLQASGRYEFVHRYDGRHDLYKGYLRKLKANHAKAHLGIGDGDTERIAMIDYGWLELERSAQQLLPDREHWQVPYQYTMEGAAQGDRALRPFLRATAAIDADTLLYGFTDVNLTIGNEQPLREFTRFLRSLPKAKFKRVDSDRPDLVVRTCQQPGGLLFYALNPVPWPVRATFALDGVAQVTDLITGDTLGAPATVRIPPYHGASFRVMGRAALRAWTTQGLGEAFTRHTAFMRQQAAMNEERLRDNRIASVLLPAEKTEMRQRLAGIREALDRERYADAWQKLNDWQFIWLTFFLERQNEALDLITERDSPAPDLAPRSMSVPRIETPPRIDGELDDSAWKRVEGQSVFVDGEGKVSGVGTVVRAAWDSENLYLGFLCRDNFPERLKGDATDELKVMHGNDCVVFLLQPDAQSSRHFQMAVTAGGVTFDQQNRDYAFAPTWQAEVSAFTNGWRVEIAFPLQVLGATPKPGDQWGVNFCRLFRDHLMPWSAWSYMPGSWHDPAGYGRLVFE